MLNNIKMKYLVLSIAILISTKTFSQADSITLYVEKLINRNINIPSYLYNDTCYFTTTLLKLDINERSIVTDLTFSDNAENWLKQGVSRLSDKMNKKVFRRYCQRLSIKNKSIIIPIIIQTPPENCASKNSFNWRDEYFDFNKEKLAGDCFFTEPIIFTLGSLVH